MVFGCGEVGLVKWDTLTMQILGAVHGFAAGSGDAVAYLFVEVDGVGPAVRVGVA